MFTENGVNAHPRSNSWNRFSGKWTWCAALALLPALAAQADFGFSGPEFLNSNTWDSRANSNARLATDGSGHWIAVWSSTDTLAWTVGQDADIFVAHSRDNGTTWSYPVPLNTNAAMDGPRAADVWPEIVGDGNGNWVVVWTLRERISGGSDHNQNVLVANSTDDGETWSEPRRLHPDSAQPADNGGPLVSVDPAGVWIVTWHSVDSLKGTIGSDYDVLFSRSFDSGTSWSAPLPLNANAASDAGADGNAQVVIVNAGEWVASWSSNNAANSTVGDFDVYTARSTDYGASWSYPAAVDAGAGSDSAVDGLSHTATDGQGGIVNVWQSNGPSTPQGRESDIRVSRSTDGGITWSPAASLYGSAAVETRVDVSPWITTDGAGSWVAVWQSFDRLGGGLGGDSDLLYARSIDNGLTWSVPQPLNHDAAFDQKSDSDPCIVTDAAGRWLTVWYHSDPYMSDILISSSIDNGATWVSAVVLNGNSGPSSGDGSDYSPQIATDKAGHWVAVWESSDTLADTIGGDRDILFARSTDNGVTWGGTLPLNANAASDSESDRNPRLAAGAGGTWIAVWDSTDTLGGTIGSDSDILFGRSTDSGVTWTFPAPLNTNAGSDTATDSYARIATDGAGRWVVVWTSGAGLGGPTGTDEDIFFSRSVDDGLTWTPPTPLNTNAASDSGNDFICDILTDGQGHWVAAWMSENDLPGTSDNGGDIHFARSFDSGATWTAPALLSPGMSADAYPYLATDGDGHWVALWMSYGMDINNLLLTFQIARSSDNGVTWTEPAALTPGVDGVFFDRIFMGLTNDGMGNWIAVWGQSNRLEESAYSDNDIVLSRSADYGATWSPPGPLVPSMTSDNATDANAALATDGSGHWVCVWNTDGYPDVWVLGNTNIFVSTMDRAADTDGDGIDDLSETNTGVYVDSWDRGTDPANPDTDGDGLKDGRDPTPLAAGAPAAWIAQDLRDWAQTVKGYNLALFAARNLKTAQRMRLDVAYALTAAANAVSAGQYGSADRTLRDLYLKLDGNPRPADAMVACPEKTALAQEIQVVRGLLAKLPPQATRLPLVKSQK